MVLMNTLKMDSHLHWILYISTVGSWNNKMLFYLNSWDLNTTVRTINGNVLKTSHLLSVLVKFGWNFEISMIPPLEIYHHSPTKYMDVVKVDDTCADDEFISFTVMSCPLLRMLSAIMLVSRSKLISCISLLPCIAMITQLHSGYIILCS